MLFRSLPLGLAAALAGAVAAQSVSPVERAAARGDLAGLRALLPEGPRSRARLAARDREGWTLLHHAARSREVEAVRFLLDRGAEHDVHGSRGLTPLHVAVQRGDAATVALLVERGAHLDAEDRAGRTPLMLARRAGDVRLLLEHGADPNARDRCGMTMLHHHAADSYWSDGDRLRLAVTRGMSMDVRDFDGRTPLFWSCMRRYPRKIEVLLQLGANPRLAQRDGTTPLHQLLTGHVCRYTCDSVLASIDRLHDACADVGAVDDSGWTPMHEAARWGEPRVLRRLIELGARPDVRDRRGRTPAQVCEQSRRHDAHKDCLAVLRGGR